VNHSQQKGIVTGLSLFADAFPSKAKNPVNLPDLINVIRAKRRNDLPEAEQIWLNARILAIQDARKRALRPIVIAEIVVRAALNLAMVAGITWLWSSFQSSAADLMPIYSKAPQPILLFIASLATCLVALLFVKLIQPILAER